MQQFTVSKELINFHLSFREDNHILTKYWPPRNGTTYWCVIWMFYIYHYLNWTEEIFLHDFLEILKQPLQNFQKILKKYFMCTDNSWWIMNKWKYGHYQELMANMTDVFQLQELEPKDSHNLKNREIVYTRNKPICPFYFFDDVTSTVFRWRHFYCFSMTSYLYCFSMTSYFYCFQKDLFICYVMLIASKYLFF